MDLVLQNRTALVVPTDSPLSRACGAALHAEGARLLGPSMAAEADIIVAVSLPLKRGILEEVGDDKTLIGGWNMVSDTVKLFRAALPRMKAKSYGRLIVVTPVAAKAMTPEADLDRIVGLGLLGMLKAASGELGPTGITCNSVLWDEPSGSLDSAIAGNVGAAVAFLASEPASFLTGVSIAVDRAGVGGTF